MKIESMLVNHVRQPLGFAADRPSFSWKVTEAGGAKRTASARIRISEDGAGELFDSGELAEVNSLDYAPGVKLKPRTAYRFCVEVTADDGEKAAGESTFETGKMEEEWRGRWISSPLDVPPVFEKKFSVEEVPGQARLYICGLGVYEVYVNGEKAGDEYLAPGYHAYDFHLQVQAYDVSGLLRRGDNTVRVFVGDGWFRGRLGFDGGYTNLYGDRNYLIAELYGDGSYLLGTDEGWSCRPSPATFSDIYDGEVFDAGLLASLDEDGGWTPVVEKVPEGCGALCDRLSLPIVRKETFPVEKAFLTPKQELVLDFGQEITGWVEFESSLPEGYRIRLTASEILQDGCFYRENYRTAKSEFVYISDGKLRHVRPHHTFYGFRYVKVEYFDEAQKAVELKEDGDLIVPMLAMDFEGVHLRSDFDEIGSLETGNEKVNRLIKNAFWGQKDNHLDVPTDCPQRDERLGWTGDAQIFSETACQNMYMPAFYRKFLWDMRAEQSILDGAVPNVVPRIKREMIGESGSCPWADAAVVIAWNVYQNYGSSTLLRETYPGMKAWLDYEYRRESALETEASERLIKDGFHFADWLALDNPQPGPFGATDPLYIASAYYYQNASRVAKAAGILGIPEDEEKYGRLAEEILASIRRKYFDTEGVCTQRTQTAAAIAIVMGLNSDEEAARRQGEVLQQLVEENDGHLNTGFVGTNMLCPALSMSGHDATAVGLLLNEDYPGWLYCVNLGATTIWERWNSVEPDGHLNPEGMNSLNHYSYGSIVGWMYQYLAGIRPTVAGYRRARIEPKPDARLGRLSCRLDTPFGCYESSWSVGEDGKAAYTVEVPFDCEAELVIDGRSTVLQAGRYTF